jgi:hypothetical protein
MYNEMLKAFEKNMSWEALKATELTQNAGYRSAYTRTMEGWQNKMPPHDNKNRFIVKNIMDYESLRILGPKGRDQLIRDLGVDAIIAARVNVELHGTSVMGFGARHPQSDVDFVMYRISQSDPIWFEGRISGPKSKESVGSTGFTDESATARLGLKSAVAAFEKIGQSSSKE